MKPKCTFCIYESYRGNKQPFEMDGKLPDATTTIQTKNGPREVCGAHAERGDWTRNLPWMLSRA